MPVITQEGKRGGSIAPPAPPEFYGSGDGSHQSGGRFPVSKGYLATWILLTGVTMLFAGLSSAYIVLRGVPSWQNITVPTLVWVNTLILISSGVAMEFARAAVKQNRPVIANQWLVVTGVMGAAFLIGQMVVWRQLTDVGVYLSTNLHSSFFYVLTGVHGLHLLGGLAGYVVVLRSGFSGRLTAAQHEPLRVWALYWHYMDVVWLYLFLLLLLA